MPALQRGRQRLWRPRAPKEVKEYEKITKEKEKKRGKEKKLPALQRGRQRLWRPGAPREKQKKKKKKKEKEKY